MKSLITWIAFLAAGVMFVAPALPASASSRGVKDDGKFFSADGIAKASAAIDDIFRKHHGKEVLVETFEDIPADTTYEQFVHDRFRDAKLNGVYIVIVRKGSHVSVRADSVTDKLFTSGVCTDLARQIVQDIKGSKRPYDAALQNAVQFIADKFAGGEKPAASPAGAQRPPAGSNSGPVVNRNTGSHGGGLFSNLWGWVCLGVGVWIVIALVRSVFAKRGGNGGGGAYGGGPGYGGYGGGYGGGMGGGFGGGGWGSSMLGGLFGAAAGSWMYDRFFRGDSGSSYGGQSGNAGGGYDNSGGGGGSSTPDWAGPGDSSSGGGAGGDASFGGGNDFGGGGDASGGGDFGGGGGGDSGGGGGGDFGGGGGDASGGGDFA